MDRFTFLVPKSPRSQISSFPNSCLGTLVPETLFRLERNRVSQGRVPKRSFGTSDPGLVEDLLLLFSLREKCNARSHFRAKQNIVVGNVDAHTCRHAGLAAI